MFEKMEHIELSGKSYPIKCDMVVLEQIQDMFGTIEEFENGIVDWEPVCDENGKEIIEEREEKGKIVKYVRTKFKFPKVKNINAAVFFMVNEGAEIEGGKPPFKTVKEAARAIDMPLSQISKCLHKEFRRCFQKKNG